MSGPTATSPRLPSVMIVATSMMRSFAGSRPVISMSIQTRRSLPAAMRRHYTKRREAVVRVCEPLAAGKQRRDRLERERFEDVGVVAGEARTMRGHRDQLGALAAGDVAQPVRQQVCFAPGMIAVDEHEIGTPVLGHPTSGDGVLDDDGIVAEGLECLAELARLGELADDQDLELVQVDATDRGRAGGPAPWQLQALQRVGDALGDHPE